MNDWLAGRRDASNTVRSIPSTSSSSSSSTVNVNLSRSTSSYESAMHIRSESGAITHSSHRVGKMSSSNNSVSSAILRGEAVPSASRKLSDTFNSQVDVACSKLLSITKTQHLLKERPSFEFPTAHVAKSTFTAKVIPKIPTQYHSNKFSLEAVKRVIKRDRAIENHSSTSGVELQDWLEEQMNEYQADIETIQTDSTKRVKKEHPKDINICAVKDEDHATPMFIGANKTLNAVCVNEGYPKGTNGVVELGIMNASKNSASQSSHNVQNICNDPNFLSMKNTLVSDSIDFIPTSSMDDEKTFLFDSISSLASGLSEHRKVSMTQYVSRPGTGALLDFEKDGRSFSRFPFTRDTALLRSANTTWPKNMALNSLNLRRILFYDNVSMQVRDGCTCIRFDSIGALFAVGSSNGVVRIFDFDECLAGMHGPTKLSPEESISAVLGIPLGAGLGLVTDIRWSLVNKDELAVSFENSSEVHIYDLARCQHSRGPLRKLQIVRGKSPDAIAANRRSGGNRVLCYMVPLISGSDERIIAGSMLGHIRLWEVPSSKNTDVSELSPVWEISPEQTSKKCVPVVGLVPLETYLLAFTACGSVTVWDVDNLCDGFFGKPPAPTLLQRVNLVLGARLSGVTHSGNAFNSAGGCLYGTVSTGSVKTIHVWKNDATERNRKKEMWKIDFDESSPHLRPRPTSAQVLNPEEVDNGKSRDSFDAPPCALLSYKGQDFVMTSLPQCLEAENSLKICSVADKHFSRPKLSPSKLYKTEHICFTLPACVVKAVPGENKITVSDDLRQFLCGGLMSSSLPGKSHQLLIAWSGPGENTAYSSQLYLLDGIESRTLFLQEPYSGPAYTSGVKFCLRTNLAPVASLLENMQAGQNQRNFFSREITVSGAGVSALESHPDLPYVVIGTRTDEVNIISALRDSSDVSTRYAGKGGMETLVPVDMSIASVNTSADSSAAPSLSSNAPSITSKSDSSERDQSTSKLKPEPMHETKRPILRTVQLGYALNGLRQGTTIGIESSTVSRKMSSLERKSKALVVPSSEPFL
jgi:hypothetical protein